MHHNFKPYNSPRTVKTIAILGLMFCAALGAVGVSSFHKLKTHYSVMEFLPSNHPALQMDQNVRTSFNIPDRPLFIGLLSMKKYQAGNWLTPSRMKDLREVTAQIKNLEGVNQAISIATVDGAADVKGTLNVGNLIALTPRSNWNSRILNDPMLAPTLITKDGRTTSLFVELNDANVETMVSLQEKMKTILEKKFPHANASIGGVPAVQTDLGILLNKELRNFLILSVLGSALTLLLIFRSVSSIFIPLVLTAFANIMVLAVMAWTGLAFTVLSSTIPILVFITVVALSAHLLLRVHEDAKNILPGETKWQLICRSSKAIWLPNLLGALTTCVGFLTLLMGDVPLIKDYGLGVAMAVMLSWFLASLGILPFLVLFPMPQPRQWVHRPARWALFVIHYRKTVVSSVLVASLALLVIGWHLHWTGRLFDDLPKGRVARQSTERIDRTMGGIIPVEIVIQAKTAEDWNEPTRVAKIAKLESEFRKIKGVGSALSIPDFLQVKGLASEAGLPKTRAGIAELYLLYSFAANNPLHEFFTSDGLSTRIQLKMHDLPADEAQALVAKLHQRVRDEFPDNQVQIGGMGAVVHLIHNELSHELIFGFWQAMLLIVILLAVIFRSIRWALVACLPNLVPPIALLGYLSLTHTPIKPGVAIIFSIALGLAFNNTVYLLNRMKSILQKNVGKDRRFPIAKTFYLEGNPCLVSTLIVMVGFSVFLFSYFSLNRTFGACMVVSITAGLVGDLIFLPALLKMYPTLLTGKLATSKAFIESDEDLQDLTEVKAA